MSAVKIFETQLKQIHSLLQDMYSGSQADIVYKLVSDLIDRIKRLNKIQRRQHDENNLFTEKDVILITYADSIISESEKPLDTFYNFAQKYLKSCFSSIHFLPFFPYSSDDGFSVIDYETIDPNLGDWDHVSKISKEYKLMFDFVLNHISAQSRWFKFYLKGDTEFKNLAIEIDPSTDISKVVRPRNLPLLTEFQKKGVGPVHVWTTFSEDQVDINYKDPIMLVKMLEVLLLYVEQGARLLRMDAIAYLWKVIGTNCIHLPQTHAFVKLCKQILEIFAPDVLIVTETNVPHEENISYFGNGTDEAQVVYNFTLPPLLLHMFHCQDNSIFSKWAKTLNIKSKQNTFLNFTASHDGIGVRPLEGIVEPEEIEKLCQITEENGGQISYKANPDGSKSPYELNITYIDALKTNGPDPDDNPLLAKRFLATQAIMLSLPGIPAVYIHSFLGSLNWYDGVNLTGRARTINRRKLDYMSTAMELESDTNNLRKEIHTTYSKLLKIRNAIPAFHPNGIFNIIDIDKHVIAIHRSYSGDDVFSIVNISEQKISIELPEDYFSSKFMGRFIDLTNQQALLSQDVELEPYQIMFIKLL